MATINANNEKLLLYTLVGCHLCEQVADMLHSMGIGCRPVEIDTDPELEEKYGIIIPVLHRLDTGRELLYPFNEEQVLKFLGNIS
jgi:hypothetical protein